MKVYEHILYKQDVAYVANLNLPWEKLNNTRIMLSGATGLIGSFLTDVIMFRNDTYGMNCHMDLIGRSEQRLRERFEHYAQGSYCELDAWNVNAPFDKKEIGKIDYVIHLASNTHPLAYATDPIGTIETNIMGTRNMLECASAHEAERCVFVSSVEIYGENQSDIGRFGEECCGYIDCNTSRAGYPESKRCGEALCQAYIAQKGMDIVIPRLARCYGATLLESDTKALSQFLHRGIAGEDIILKSQGTQCYSYLYAADAVAGILVAMLKGACGNAYNLADEKSDILLRELAAIVAEYTGKKVIFEQADSVESAGYSKATRACMDSAKIKKLGWKAQYDIYTGVKRTITILKEI